MVILTAFAILSMPFLLIKLIRAEAARTSHTADPPQACAEPSGWAGAISRDGAAWSALDDRQLTRLLASSARRSTTEGPTL